MLVLTIGVAARNEEATIEDSLRSIEVALAELGEDVAAEVIVAINDSTDRTQENGLRLPAPLDIVFAHRNAVAIESATPDRKCLEFESNSVAPVNRS